MWREIGNAESHLGTVGVIEGGEREVFSDSLFDESWDRQSGQTRMRLLAVEPSTLFAYWEVDVQRQKLCSQHFQRNWSSLPLFLRVYDVTLLNFDGFNAHAIYQNEVHSTTDNWYLHDVQPGRHYLGDLCTTTAEGKYLSIVQSNVVATPWNPTYQHIGGQVKFAPLWSSRQTDRFNECTTTQRKAIAFNGSNQSVVPYPAEFDGYSVRERG